MLIDPEEFLNSLKQKDTNYIDVIYRLALYHTDTNNHIYQIKLKNDEHAFIVDTGNTLFISYIEDLQNLEEDYSYSDFNSVLRLVSH